MRTRTWVLLLGLSLAANVLLATALWRSQAALRGAATASPAAAAAPVGAEERSLRERLAGLLCAQPPDRAAIAAVLDRLDTLRAGERSAAVERWLSTCRRMRADDRAAMQNGMKRILCPWKAGGNGCCAPAPPRGAGNHQPARPRT